MMCERVDGWTGGWTGGWTWSDGEGGRLPAEKDELGRVLSLETLSTAGGFLFFVFLFMLPFVCEIRLLHACMLAGL